MQVRDPRDEPRYAISVAARLVDLHPQTLRHYENIGLLAPERSEGNRRLYSERDLERLRLICRLTGELGVNLAGVEVILNMTEQIQSLREERASRERHLLQEIAQLRRMVATDVHHRSVPYRVALPPEVG